MPGIALVSICLGAYEALALVFRKTTISDYSHRWPQSLLVWGWLVWLIAHFISEGRKAH